jgi:hypothetical protein
MTESPAHDVECELKQRWFPTYLERSVCACSWRASLVALEREAYRALQERGEWIAKWTEAANAIEDLKRERDEDRQAIRALKEDHDVSGWTKGNPCTCEVCREHAAAIQRAQERP